MTSQPRWYTELETFVAVAALIVSVTAVMVGIQEAAPQRGPGASDSAGPSVR
jgi:hypothetical protein